MEKRKLKLNKQTLRNLSVLSDVRGGSLFEDIVFPDPDPSSVPNCSHDSCTCRNCPNPEPPADPQFPGFPGIPNIDLTGLTIGGGGGPLGGGGPFGGRGFR